MDTIKELLLWVISIILLVSCVSTSNILSAKLVYAEDNRCYEDSIYNIEIKLNKSARHGGKIELRYKIQNDMQKCFYFPFRSIDHESYKSSFRISFLTDNDTIMPSYTIDRSPSDSVYLCHGESVYMILRIFNFNDWQRKECNTTTPLEEMLKKLNINYLPSDKDKQYGEQCDFPKLEIDSNLDNVTTFIKETGKRYAE